MLPESNRYILTGGPGCGKTTDLLELKLRGFTCVDEVARRLIQERLFSGLSPRPGPKQFAAEIFARDVKNYDSIVEDGKPIFFDRGIGDSLGMLLECGAISKHEAILELGKRPFARQVFVFPAWADIYSQDSERDQVFVEAVEIEARLRNWYGSLGFDISAVPLASPEERADFILKSIS